MERVLSQQEQNKLGTIKALIKNIGKELAIISEKRDSEGQQKSFKIAKQHLKTAALYVEDGLKN